MSDDDAPLGSYIIWYFLNWVDNTRH